MISLNMRNSFIIKNKIFYPILAVYLIYTLFYISKSYYGFGNIVINSLDHTTTILWMLIGFFTILITIYSIWRKKSKKYIIWSALLLLFFYPYTWLIIFFEILFFGLGS
jgi:hypothetical protein